MLVKEAEISLGEGEGEKENNGELQGGKRSVKIEEVPRVFLSAELAKKVLARRKRKRKNKGESEY